MLFETFTPIQPDVHENEKKKSLKNEMVKIIKIHCLVDMADRCLSTKFVIILLGDVRESGCYG